MANEQTPADALEDTKEKQDADDLKAKNLKAFDVAHQNRNIEVDLFWKRAIFFWGFIAAAMIGYVTLSKNNSDLKVVVSTFGLFIAFLWTLANRGSKYWQEYWERKVESLESAVVGDLFVDDTPAVDSNKWLSARKFSVSKLTIAISDYLVFFWACIAIYEISAFYAISVVSKGFAVGVFVVLTVIYMFAAYANSKSRLEKKNKL